MKTIFASLISISISFLAISQDFSSKISQNASMVFTINGNSLLSKVDEKELNESAVFKQFKKEFGNPEVATMADFGLDFTKNFVYAHEWDTNLSVSLFFMPIKDPAKFAKIIPDGYNPEVKKTKGYKVVERNGRKIAWNNEFAVFISGNYVGDLYEYQYSYDDELLEYNYYQENRALNQIMEEDSENEWSLEKQSDRMDEILELGFKVSKLDNNAPFPEKYTKKELEEVKQQMNLQRNTIEVDELSQMNDEIEVVDEMTVETIEVAIDAAEEAAEEYNENNYYRNESRKRELRDYRSDKRNAYRNHLREATERKREILTQLLFDARASSVFTPSASFQSINKNESFAKSGDKKADGTFWLRNQTTNSLLGSGIMREMYGYRYSRMYRDLGMLGSSLNQMNSDYSVTKLFFEKEGVRFVNNTENNKNQVNSTNNIYSTTQDKRFFDYVNGDDFLGYMSLTFNSKALIEVMPQLYLDMYGRFSRDNQEELQVLVEMIGIFLDEKAIGDLATGNAFFVLKDMVKKEVTYDSYEQDENYETVVVEKTKTELLPDFLFMFTTNNEPMLNKIMGLGIKNEVLFNNSKYYTVNKKKTHYPVDIFFVIKEGIVFVSTNETEIKTIVQGGKFENNLLAKHQKMVGGNSQVVYVNNQKITEYVASDMFSLRNQEEYQMYKEFGCQEIVITSKNTGGNMETTGYLATPNDEANSAVYFFNFLNRMMESDN